MDFIIKIELHHVHPVVWRRLLVPADYSMTDFHNLVQTVMGWTNSHLHQFIKGGKFYYNSANTNFFDNTPNNIDYSNIKISDLLVNEGDQIDYEYDFGDSWMHTLTLEKIVTQKRNSTKPLCMNGEGICPPEDCGGPFAYNNLTKAIGKASKSPSKIFNPEAVNSILNQTEILNPTELTYKELLTNHKTKEEIISIGRFLGLPIKVNSRKHVIAEFIESALLTNPGIIKNALSYKEIECLDVIYNNNKKPETFMKFEEISELIFFGFIDISKNVEDSKNNLRLPQNIKRRIAPQLKDFLADSEFRRNFEIENTILGLLTLFGILKLKDLAKMVSENLHEKFGTYKILEIANTTFKMLSRTGTTMFGDSIGIHHPGMYHPDKIVKEIKNRKDTEYKEFTRDEIFKAASDIFYYTPNDIADKLIEIFNDLTSNEHSQLLMHDIWLMSQNDQPLPDIFAHIFNELNNTNIKTIQSIAPLITEYNNKIPLWVLKGNSPTEISQKEQSGFRTFTPDIKVSPPRNIPFVHPKVGRNDPCPCGSGKKYKHCCGNN